MVVAQPRLLIAYVSGLVLAASALCIALVLLGYRLESPLVVLCLAAATAVAERWSVPISATTDLTVYLLPTVFAAVVFGPLAAGVIAAASMLGDPELFRRGDPSRAVARGRRAGCRAARARARSSPRSASCRPRRGSRTARCARRRRLRRPAPKRRCRRTPRRGRRCGARVACRILTRAACGAEAVAARTPHRARTPHVRSARHNT